MKPLRLQKKLVIIFVLVFTIQVLCGGVLAEEIPTARERNQMVRVFLTRLGITDRMDITLEGDYRLVADRVGEIHFQTGSQIALLLRNDDVYLHYEGLVLRLGSGLVLERTQQDGGFFLTNFPTFYQGNLHLDVSQNVLRPVLAIHVEDYLKGVVPYEMSELFPLEALKAQAVAARTYALRRQNANMPYDVVDNTNDQVFKGYLSGNIRAEQAIAETRGVCGFYKGDLAQCFYSASNGGQTELVETVWPDRGNYGYYAFGEDPYDLENPQSVVRTFEMQRTYTASAPYALRKCIAETQSELLSELGYDASPENIRVDEVLAADVNTPDSAGSKRMTMLNISLKISGRKNGQGVTIRLIDDDTEEVSLFGPNVQETETPDPNAPAVTAEPVEKNDGPFVPLDQPLELKIPIFPEAEDVFGMDISSNYENEIWTVVESEDKFVLEARRYGHGVGMSQRGAQWMAGTYEKTYREILDFYYPGMELKRYPEQLPPIAQMDSALSETAGPPPSPTPRPTLMPVTQQLAQGQWYAEVTEIADDSSLNLRAAPSLNAQIAMRLYKGQKLLVAERCAEDGWVRVLTDAAEGYVMEKYLTKIQ